jgi:CDP-glucose 4,6-dehydratase
MQYSLGQRLRELQGPVLLTGHTGFKGTWMTFLLELLEVPVVGYSLPAEKNSLFDRAERKGAIPEAFADIRDYETLEEFADLHRPSTIIHMAAQPLVLKSYENPRETFEVNVMGTVNVLNMAFKKDFVKSIVVVTTDKVYKNNNSGRAFVETDPLEGKDPYSASKVGTEAVARAWQQIAKVSKGPDVVTVRAGNVIGGGDFAKNRIIPDLIRGVIEGNKVKIRNPQSTRPWEHVVEPLIGYLNFLVYTQKNKNVSALNFGPSDKSLPVSEVVKIFSKYLNVEIIDESLKQSNIAESEKLELNAKLAYEKLGWATTVSQEEAISLTAKWWLHLLEGNLTIRELCENDIHFFLKRHNMSDGRYLS